MDFWTFIGGLTMGAAAAAIYDMSSSPKLMGADPRMGVILDEDDEDLESDPPSSGGGSAGPGVFVGPPSGGGGMAPSGPSVSVMPSVQSPMAPPVGIGPSVSVPPIVQNGSFGDSFFGVSASPWFGSLNYWPYPYPYPRPNNQAYICKKETTDEGEERFTCVPKLPLQNVAYTYGPPGYW